MTPMTTAPRGAPAGRVGVTAPRPGGSPPSRPAPTSPSTSGSRPSRRRTARGAARPCSCSSAPTPRGGEDVVLTERAHTLRSHPGQVSFPGGRLDPDDDGLGRRPPCARREEEVGLDPAGVEVLATFPDVFLAPSQHAVTPVLAWWPDAGAGRRRRPRRGRAGAAGAGGRPARPRRNRFTVGRSGPTAGPAFEVGDLFVWGFTAMLLSSLFDLAGLTRPWDTARRATAARPGHVAVDAGDARVSGSVALDLTLLCLLAPLRLERLAPGFRVGSARARRAARWRLPRGAVRSRAARGPRRHLPGARRWGCSRCSPP